MPRHLLRGAAALLVMALSACDGASEPQGVEGRYGVYSVNGHKPPVPVRGDPSGAQVQVVDAQLTLSAPNAASVLVATRVRGADGTVGATTRTTYTGTYQQNADRLVLSNLQAEGTHVGAEGVVISPREVAVTLHVAV
ncbi:MAG TPA: hypothetical protein VFR37_02755, partial [Longimicrobium sp.]|nr:hypothetical protein [Longimicrobium sp.]